MSRSAIETYFAPEQFGAILEVKPISLGLSGASVYDVATERGAYVLRVLAPHVQNWERQLAVLRLASDNGVAPHIAQVDEAERATISEKIAGDGFIGALREAAERGPAIMSLVDQLAKMHAIPAAEIVALDPLTVVRELWNAQSSRPGFPEWATSLNNKFAAFDEILLKDERRVLSHNDLNPANILWDGQRVWLVDFEASARTHPYYDLATISVFLSLPTESAIGLLAKQESARITVDQVETFNCLRTVATILYGLTFLSIVPDLQQLPTTTLEETSTLSDCYGMMSTGKLVLQNASGQGAMGKAFLKLAVD